MRLTCLSLVLLLAPSVADAQAIVTRSPSFVQQSDLAAVQAQIAAEVSARAAAVAAQSAIDQAAAQTAAATAQASAIASAPVKTVNTLTGNVVVPTPCRQQSASTAIPTASPASLTWTFPLANNPQACNFATPPSCWSDISTTASGTVFDYPLGGTRTTSGVTYTYTAHAASVNVIVAGATILAVGGVSGAPPSGSTVVLTCTAPPA